MRKTLTFIFYFFTALVSNIYRRCVTECCQSHTHMHINIYTHSVIYLFLDTGERVHLYFESNKSNVR